MVAHFVLLAAPNVPVSLPERHFYTVLFDLALVLLAGRQDIAAAGKVAAGTDCTGMRVENNRGRRSPRWRHRGQNY